MHALKDRIDQLAGWMFESRHLVVFTGAGISTGSGLPDFRGPDGVWTRRDKGLPARDESRDWTRARPNAGHLAVAELQSLGRLAFLVSQNIDNLHLASGIDFERIAELHGNLTRSRCSRCAVTRPKEDAAVGCECGGQLTSSVVGFGDPMPERDLELSFAHARACDLMVVLGSSLVVTPAADVPRLAAESGARLVIVNQGETPLDRLAHLRFDETIETVFPAAVEGLRIRLRQGKL